MSQLTKQELTTSLCVGACMLGKSRAKCLCIMLHQCAGEAVLPNKGLDCTAMNKGSITSLACAGGSVNGWGVGGRVSAHSIQKTLQKGLNYGNRLTSPLINPSHMYKECNWFNALRSNAGLFSLAGDSVWPLPTASCCFLSGHVASSFNWKHIVCWAEGAALHSHPLNLTKICNYIAYNKIYTVVLVISFITHSLLSKELGIKKKKNYKILISE